MVCLVLAGEYWIAHSKLSHYAPKGPHVNCRSVGDPEDDVWCTVKPRLNISVHSFALKTTAAKIYNLDSTLCRIFEQNVLGLEITVDHVVFLQILQGVKQLDRETANEAKGKALKFIEFQEFIKVN